MLLSRSAAAAAAAAAAAVVVFCLVLSCSVLSDGGRCCWFTITITITITTGSGYVGSWWLQLAILCFCVKQTSQQKKRKKRKGKTNQQGIKQAGKQPKRRQATMDGWTVE